MYSGQEYFTSDNKWQKIDGLEIYDISPKVAQ